MEDGKAFEHVCAELESSTSFNRLEARGTVRLALKGAGINPAKITAAQMQVVVKRVLPKELSNRGVDDAEAICNAIVGSLSTVQDDIVAESPEAIFERLGR